MSFLRQNSVRGPVYPVPTNGSFSGYEGCIFCPGNFASVNGNYEPYTTPTNNTLFTAGGILPTSQSSTGIWVLADGGLGGLEYPFNGNMIDLTLAQRTVRAWTNAVTFTPGTRLVLANPATAIPGGSLPLTDEIGSQLPMTTLAGFITPLPTLGSGAILTPVVSVGKITSLTIIAGGTSYLAGQNITFLDANGYGALYQVATVNATTGALLTFTAVNQGAAYTAPQAVIAPPGIPYWSIGWALQSGSGNYQLTEFSPHTGLYVQ